MKIRHIATRFALLLGVAAVLPLVAYGVVSILSLQRGTRESVVNGNQNVAVRAAEEIRRYVVSNAELLKALAADLQDTGLDQRQQDQILKNYVLQFREFREISLFDERGAMIASSRVGKPRVVIPKDAQLTINGVSMSPIRVDEDLLPTSVFSIRLTHLNQPAGWLAGEFSLEEMWRMVDQIRIGDHGFAMVVAPGGELVAHGDPNKKALVAQMRNMSGNQLFAAARTRGDVAPVSQEYTDEDGGRQLGVAARIAQLGWTVIVEQPTREAYASATVLQRQLGIAIGVALLIMIAVGYRFGRSFINPILTLQRGTHAVAAGALDTRVAIATRDEFGELGDAFNTMAGRLKDLQEDVKRQERAAMFGRCMVEPPEPAFRGMRRVERTLGPHHRHPRFARSCLRRTPHATLAIAGYEVAAAVWQLMLASLLFNALETAGTIVWATAKQRHVPPCCSAGSPVSTG